MNLASHSLSYIRSLTFASARVAVATVAVVAFAVTTAKAEPSGYPGRTSSTTAGCGDCHGNDASSATTVTLQGGAPSAVLPGSTTTFTIVIAHATQKVTGIGIAIKTTANGSTAAGTLAVVAGQMTRLRNGEITHSSPKAMSSGQATYSFTWTAPTAEGTYYLQAIGNACNGNGREDSGDSWAFLQAVPIVVSSTNAMNEMGMQSACVMNIAPHPVMSGMMATLQGMPVSAQHLTIVSSAGMVVYQRDLASASSEQPIAIPELPSGTYAVLVTTRTSVVTAPLVVLR